MQRFQKLDASGQVTDSPDYVAVLESRFDPLTGAPVRLMWARTLIEVKNWKAAEKACSKLKLCDFDDWCMPTVQERELITDKARHFPAIDPIFNSPEAGWEWTCTATAFSPAGFAWNVNFNYGVCDWGNRDNDGFVRAVRVSQ